MRWSYARLFSVWGPAHDRPACGRTARHGAAHSRAAHSRAARDAARWRRGRRSAPAVAVLLLGRSGGAVMTARGPARRARARWPEKAVRSRRHAPPIWQPAASVGPAAVRRDPVVHRPVRPVREPPVRRAAVRPGRMRCPAVRPGRMRCCGVRPRSVRSGGIRRPAVRPRPMRPAIGVTATRIAAVGVPAVGIAAVGVPAVGVVAVRITAVRAAGRTAARSCPLRPAIAGTAVRRHPRREPARLTRLTRVGPPRLAGPRRTGRRLAGTVQQLPVAVLFEVCRQSRPGRIVLLNRRGITLVRGVGSRTVATAIALASRQTVRVTAEAGVATFHQMPPGPCCPAVTRDACPYPLSVGRRKSPV
jgi:hypothetical protein